MCQETLIQYLKILKKKKIKKKKTSRNELHYMYLPNNDST